MCKLQGLYRLLQKIKRSSYLAAHIGSVFPRFSSFDMPGVTERDGRMAETLEGVRKVRDMGEKNFSFF